MYSWLVQVTVDPVWVADGFNLNDDTAREMVGNWLSHAHGSEYDAKVMFTPDIARIAKEQGFSSVEAMCKVDRVDPAIYDKPDSSGQYPLSLYLSFESDKARDDWFSAVVVGNIFPNGPVKTYAAENESYLRDQNMKLLEAAKAVSNQYVSNIPEDHRDYHVITKLREAIAEAE